jgi:hypothetical protein
VIYPRKMSVFTLLPGRRNDSDGVVMHICAHGNDIRWPPGFPSGLVAFRSAIRPSPVTLPLGGCDQVPH